MSDLSISLVIPTFNRADLILSTIESALAQTKPFFEIIVVDDGSVDETKNVLRPILEKIRLIQTGNCGVQAARNVGVSAAMSSHVTLCDSDDILEPFFVETIQSWFTAMPKCRAVYSNFVTFNQLSVFPDKFSFAPASYFKGGIFHANFITDIPDLYCRTIEFQPLFPTGSTFERRFYLELGGFDQHFRGIGSEDWEFTLRVIGATSPALCVKPLVRIRKHDNNASRSTYLQSLGESNILSFALTHHPSAIQYREIILDSIVRRRFLAFNGAFALGNFDHALQIDSLLPINDTLPLRHLLKRFVLHTPPIIRAILWQCFRVLTIYLPK